VDTGKVAALIGAQRVRRASPDFVRAATGQTIGGVAPVGHPAPLRTIVDRFLERYDEVWAAGGIPHAVFPSTCAELVKVTGGEPADVA
jgi:prolyl-tRNA editing enzyme YbaK/EbsC (Cys-tRNA(Pro) deacylase)